MTKLPSNRLPHSQSQTPLMTAYHDAVLAFTEVIAFGTAFHVLTAFRAVLVARLALAREGSEGSESASSATTEAVEHEISNVDRNLADRACRLPN